MKRQLFSMILLFSMLLFIVPKSTSEKSFNFFTDEAGGNSFSDVHEVTQHKYSDPKWTWNGYDSAIATFTCRNDDSHIETMDAAIKHQTIEPSCETDGKIVYTATVNFKGNQYTDTRSEKLPAIEHSWSEPEWVWEVDTSTVWNMAEGRRKARATFICQNDPSHVIREDAVVKKAEIPPSCTEDGEITYTATVEFDGKLYTDIQTEVLKATAHNYDEPKWTWNGYDSAIATFTCRNDDSHIETMDAAIKRQTTEPTREKNGSNMYIATVMFYGESYTNIKTEDIPKRLYDLADVNSDRKITAKDSMLIQRYVINLVQFSDIQLEAADVNRDGKVTNKDALSILRFTVGYKVEGLS